MKFDLAYIIGLLSRSYRPGFEITSKIVQDFHDKILAILYGPYSMGHHITHMILHKNFLWLKSKIKLSEPIASVKPFKSKNLDKIYLIAPNPNLKKGSYRDSRAAVYPIN